MNLRFPWRLFSENFRAPSVKKKKITIFKIKLQFFYLIPMTDWDEGGVFVSNVGADVPAQDELFRKGFVEFLLKFREGNSFIYRFVEISNISLN
jgi:hypothetical protein